MQIIRTSTDIKVITRKWPCIIGVPCSPNKMVLTFVFSLAWITCGMSTARLWILMFAKVMCIMNTDLINNRCSHLRLWKTERSKVTDFDRLEWSIRDIATKFSQAPCNFISLVLCKFQSYRLIEFIFQCLKPTFIALLNKNLGGQVSKSVACTAEGHRFESCCRKKQYFCQSLLESQAIRWLWWLFICWCTGGKH